MGPPGDLDMVGCFYRRLLLFADYAILAGLKLGEQVFDDHGVDPVAGVGIPYGKSVEYDRHERRIDRIRRHDGKVSG